MGEKIRTFEEAFNEFISQRLIKDLDIILLNNKELIAINKKADQYRENVRIAFIECNKNLFEDYIDEYESTQSAVGRIISEKSYVHGMKDAYKLLKMLEKENKIESEEKQK